MLLDLSWRRCKAPPCTFAVSSTVPPFPSSDHPMYSLVSDLLLRSILLSWLPRGQIKDAHLHSQLLIVGL